AARCHGICRSLGLATRARATLLDLRLDKSITQDEYDKKARELKQRQTEIALRIEQHQKGGGDFRTTLEPPAILLCRTGARTGSKQPQQKRSPYSITSSAKRDSRPGLGDPLKRGRVLSA